MDSVSTIRLGRMPKRQLRIAMSNMALWATAMALPQSNWFSHSFVARMVPENHWGSPSFTFTPTPITSNRSLRMYSSVVILESEKVRS